MNSTPAPRPEYGADQSLRQRLIKRIALAALAIAALLGGLAVIDRYYVPPPATPPRTLSASLTPPQPVKPIEPPPVAPPVPAAPEQTSSPSITKPATGHADEVKPMESARKVESSRPLAAGAIHPAPPAKSATAKKMPDEDRPASRAVARHAPPPKPLARGKEAQKQYVFQMGVFNDVANAQTLNDKLKQAGVPSRIEARVQVGPFKTRKEAEEARRKLVALGMNPGVLAPVRK